ncbi:unnamed protein product, partial [Symbiodinium necroappetens]
MRRKWRAFKQVRKQGLRGWFMAWKAWKAFDAQLFRGWSRPTAQHDVATFIEHILAKQKPLAIQGRQQSRLGISAGQAVVYDAGSIATPIILHEKGDGTLDSLQGCIDRWHMQARPHGLAEAYFVIMLQLVGYKHGAMATK